MEQLDLFGVTYNLGGCKEKFLDNPFSVLKQNDKWTNYNNKIKNLGVKSEIGRNVTTYNPNMGMKNGTSTFHPFLTKLMYKWFCDDGGTILDPFAGGSVRGIVASLEGYNYTGIDIRQEQIDSNLEQAINICPKNIPTWLVGDSNKVLDEIGGEFDMVFSCPPYADLEVYSDLEGDISNMNYEEFLVAYRSIIKKKLRKTKRWRICCFRSW